ncbi:MAG: GNAT family N-acetyltransferase [Rikenellaceae bacterium]
MELTLELCDYSNPAHLSAFAELLQGYMADPMGEHAPHTKMEQLRLIDGMANHPSSFILLASVEGQAVGFATCFELFSTFQVKPFINIHDFFTITEYRGAGIGRAMLSEIAEIARSKRCCKVTLEVRTDNSVAQGLYRSEGFAEAEPDMLFWTKKL